ncbi:nuclear pore complex subunit [Zalerion maritima]|uniref:Nuclear pore complex subunit n=1 Tax=Zalerion maritima TaxID=339359 RepID=A0AAD5RUZ0_9PEZI|nr:nuclear pore complex subunit [Zalerion maritima]
MSELTSLETFQVLHRDLRALCEKRFDAVDLVSQALEEVATDFKSFLSKPARSSASRTSVQSGKIKYENEEYQINTNFQEICLQLADFLDLDELQSAKILLDSEADQITLSRPLIECGVVRFHQRRKYLLDCARLLLQLSLDVDLPEAIYDFVKEYVETNILCQPPPGAQRLVAQQDKLVPKCLTGIRDIRAMLQKLSERIASQSVVSGGPPQEFQETLEYTRVSLIQQHELLGIVMWMGVENQHAVYDDLQDFLSLLRKSDKYDNLLAHLFPALGAFVVLFGSPESNKATIQEAKNINTALCKPSDNEPWTLTYLGAAVRAWWITEYGGWYGENGTAELPLSEFVQEESLINDKFMEALKDGAFDMILSIAADVQPSEWQDPARSGMRQWLQRKAPSIMGDSVQFSEYYRAALMSQYELFVDSFITNHPDVLRKLRVEEDEQRQLSHDHEQDLNLERFLLIISYTYDGRPDAGTAFWDDSESNLAGFMQWASRRASTPLVCAFCEALQSISENEDCATAAHQFLNEKTNQTSGKMRQSLSLTWTQIFKELIFFSNKIRERPSVPQSHVYRGGKGPHEPTESEPESAMMLESYLRLITKLASKSVEPRDFLLKHPDFNLVDVLYQLAGSAIPPRLRACTFNALRSLMTDKLQEDGDLMWTFLDSWMTGGMQVPSGTQRPGGVQTQHPTALMESIFAEIGNGFEEPSSFIQFLTSLITPAGTQNALNDTLPFPENLGSANRQPGIELYVDFVLGHVFSLKSSELEDTHQLRLIRLSCLEFALICLSTFNENLLVIGSETNINVDQAIATSDLSAYIRLHPFARVMEWMFNDKVLQALLSTVHQDAAEVGNSTPDSPIILGILRSVEIISKVLELQDTYLDLVRKHVKIHSAGTGRQEVSNTSYGGFEDGLLNHLSLVVDLGNYCAVGHPELTLACLKLLEKISTSSRIISAWNPGAGRASHRNKAIVALEANDDGEAISGAFSAELTVPLDVAREEESPNYQIKIYILEFLYACIRATPSQPTIAHLLLGFKCQPSTLSIEPNEAFDGRCSLFHNLLKVLLETPFGDPGTVRYWLVNLKYKIMRVLQALWSSPLSSCIVMAELRENNILFHLLVREMLIESHLPWEGQMPTGPDFLLKSSGLTLIHFLSTRAMTLEYVSRELCGVAQGQLPTLKRKVFDALNGQTIDDNNQPMDLPTIFDLFDFLQDGPWHAAEPQFDYCKDVNTSALMEMDAEGNNIFSVEKAKELLQLKGGEFKSNPQLATADHLAKIEEEEGFFFAYLVYTNRMRQLSAARLRVLRSWTNVLLMMIETSDFKGATKISFLLQALQAVLPSLEQYSADAPEEAYPLAKVAKILLYRIEFMDGDRMASAGSIANGTGAAANGGSYMGVTGAEEREQRALGTLISDKLHQLFQVCLQSIGKWAGNGDLRTIYYTICYRYLTAMVDRAEASAQPRSAANGGSASASTSVVSSFLPGGGARKALLAVHTYGERLLNVVCDDAYGGDATVQTAAMTLLRTLVTSGTALGDNTTIETLNRLNFIGVVVDSLRNIMHEWMSIISPSPEQQQQQAQQQSFGHSHHHHHNRPRQHKYTPDPQAITLMHAKLALLLSLAQTKSGAKHVLHANLLRNVEQSGLFSADPELQLDSADLATLALHYGVLATVARILACAVMSRGEHNVLQGRNFLKAHRTLVLHVLKRSAGIGMGLPGGEGGYDGGPIVVGGRVIGRGAEAGNAAQGKAEEERRKDRLRARENVEELAEAFMVLITATRFLEFEAGEQPVEARRGPVMFH